MNHHKYLIVCFLVICLALSGCASSALNVAVMPKPPDSILNAFQKAVADCNNRFGFDLYAELVDGKDNLLISPASVALALAMTYNGSEAETKDAMARTLKIEGIDLDTLNRNNLALLYFLRTADPKVRLEIANSLWMRDGYEFDSEFLARNQEFYLAGLETLDFGRDDAADTINAWVEDNTHGLIDQIIEGPIHPLTIMFLINAVYFQGTWTDRFSKEATQERPFYKAGGGEVPVPMMNRTGDYDYLETPDFQAIRLPYGEEERMAMYVFLPAETLGLQGFEASLTFENWENWLTGFQKTEGNIQLPRFTLEYENSLKDTLKAMGMEIAFDPGKANFHNMVPGIPSQNIYIAEVKHKTFIKVDEVGTEAAAATSVEMRQESMPVNFFNMKVDRPFFYAIHDRDTGAILFMGSVQDPS
ncbi:MAG TPA: serpin family protein [Firmicutes bacterium]|nr:serpin family protein [Bacillota bacterium]